MHSVSLPQCSFTSFGFGRDVYWLLAIRKAVYACLNMSHSLATNTDSVSVVRIKLSTTQKPMCLTHINSVDHTILIAMNL